MPAKREPTRRELNGYVDRLLDGLATRVATRLPASPRTETPPLHAVEGVEQPAPPEAGSPIEPTAEPETTAEPQPSEAEPSEAEPSAAEPSAAERAARTILADPRLAADLRRADRAPDASARPYEEICRELGIG